MIRVPGKPVKMKYTKLNIIERHLTAAVQMIAIKCNPFSTHIVVKAAHEMVQAVAKKKGVSLAWDPQVWIKDEHQGDYRKLANKAYNYLKHADKDTDAPYDGPEYSELTKLNEVLTLLNLNGYEALGGKMWPTLNDFAMTAMIKYPQYFKDEFLDSIPTLRERLQMT